MYTDYKILKLIRFVLKYACFIKKSILWNRHMDVSISDAQVTGHLSTSGIGEYEVAEVIILQLK